MAGPSDDHHLQNITLSKIPIPKKDIPCQELLRKNGVHSGWLRRKKPWKILNNNFGALLQSIAWDQRFVIVQNGCLYLYNSANDSKPDKAISLFGYTRVMRAGELRSTPWSFKVAYVLDNKDRVHYFGAASEQDMLKWLKHIKRELYRANGVDYSDDCDSDEDIHDLETPISTGNYFQKIKNIDKIKKVVRNEDDDSDMDSDYDYIDDPLVGDASASKAPRSAMLPAITRGPMATKKPGVRSPNIDTSFQKTPNTSSSSKVSSPDYYPPLLNSDSGATPRPSVPVPSKKTNLGKAVSHMPPASKVPPATPVKPKPNTNDAQSGKRPMDESPKASTSFGSVAELRQGLFSEGLMTSTPKPNFGLKSQAESRVAPSPGAGKPLPALPPSIKKSNTPTAVVSPVRQLSATPPITQTHNRLPKDLETSAMWTKSPGDGQRLLVTLDQEGVYMLRQCTDGSNATTLLVIADCQLRKYKIFKDTDGMFSLKTDFSPCFDSVHNLLNYYRTNYLPLRQTKLSSAYSELSIS